MRKYLNLWAINRQRKIINTNKKRVRNGWHRGMIRGNCRRKFLKYRRILKKTIRDLEIRINSIINIRVNIRIITVIIKVKRWEIINT